MVYAIRKVLGVTLDFNCGVLLQSHIFYLAGGEFEYMAISLY